MAEYYTLINALPSLPSPERCRQLPLSRIALDRRLGMLSEGDAQQLALIEQLYRPPVEQLQVLADSSLLQQWQSQLAQVESEAMRHRIGYQLEIRTFLAALRYRAAGQQGAEQFQGGGRWLGQIRRHWFEPRFGLDRLMPELAELEQAFSEGQPGLLQQRLNILLWQDLYRYEQQAMFSFEAVACFVLRWGLIEHCLCYSGEQALTRFRGMTASLLQNSGLQQSLNRDSQYE